MKVGCFDVQAVNWKTMSTKEEDFKYEGRCFLIKIDAMLLVETS